MLKRHVIPQQTETTFNLSESSSPSENEITFSSKFDSGNCGNVTMISDKEFDIEPYPDFDATNNKEGWAKSWFYFKVEGFNQSTVKFNVKRLKMLYQLWVTNSASSYRPVFRIGDEGPFTRLPTPVTLQDGEKEGQLQMSFSFDFSSIYAEQAIRSSNSSDNSSSDDDMCEESESKSTLNRSQYVFSSPPAVYFSFSYPYSYAQNLKFIDSLESMNRSSDTYLHKEILTYTPQMRLIHLITISSMDSILPTREAFLSDAMFPERDYQPRAFKFSSTKPVVLLSARVHPGETPASFALEGLVKFLLHPTDLRALMLRRFFTFMIVPMLNPDGVYCGHYRMDIFNQNLNRFYQTPMNSKQPAIYAMNKLITHLSQHNRLFFYMDFHSHARNKPAFLYGNAIDSFHLQVENMLFAKVLSLNDPTFDYSTCNFSRAQMKSKDNKEELTKEGCGRVFSYEQSKIVHCYTLECGFHHGYGSSRKSNSSGILQPTPSNPDFKLTFNGQEYSLSHQNPYNTSNLMQTGDTPSFYNPEIFENTGKAVLISLLDVYSKNPYSVVINAVPTTSLTTIAAVPGSGQAVTGPCSAIDQLRLDTAMELARLDKLTQCVYKKAKDILNILNSTLFASLEYKNLFRFPLSTIIAPTQSSQLPVANILLNQSAAMSTTNTTTSSMTTAPTLTTTTAVSTTYISDESYSSNATADPTGIGYQLPTTTTNNELLDAGQLLLTPTWPENFAEDFIKKHTGWRIAEAKRLKKLQQQSIKNSTLTSFSPLIRKRRINKSEFDVLSNPTSVLDLDKPSTAVTSITNVSMHSSAAAAVMATATSNTPNFNAISNPNNNYNLTTPATHMVGIPLDIFAEQIFPQRQAIPSTIFPALNSLNSYSKKSPSPKPHANQHHAAIIGASNNISVVCATTPYSSTSAYTTATTVTPINPATSIASGRCFTESNRKQHFSESPEKPSKRSQNKSSQKKQQSDYEMPRLSPLPSQAAAQQQQQYQQFRRGFMQLQVMRVTPCSNTSTLSASSRQLLQPDQLQLLPSQTPTTPLPQQQQQQQQQQKYSIPATAYTRGQLNNLYEPKFSIEQLNSTNEDSIGRLLPSFVDQIIFENEVMQKQKYIAQQQAISSLCANGNGSDSFSRSNQLQPCLPHSRARRATGDSPVSFQTRNASTGNPLKSKQIAQKLPFGKVNNNTASGQQKSKRMPSNTDNPNDRVDAQQDEQIPVSASCSNSPVKLYRQRGGYSLSGSSMMDQNENQNGIFVRKPIVEQPLVFKEHDIGIPQTKSPSNNNGSRRPQYYSRAAREHAKRFQISETTAAPSTASGSVVNGQTKPAETTSDTKKPTNRSPNRNKRGFCNIEADNDPISGMPKQSMVSKLISSFIDL